MYAAKKNIEIIIVGIPFEIILSFSVKKPIRLNNSINTEPATIVIPEAVISLGRSVEVEIKPLTA